MSQNNNTENIPVTILVAEDDQEMMELLNRILSEEGYQVIGAKNGREAVQRIEQGRFDIVLTDLKMPGASGLDVLRKARSRTLFQPVVLMTAFGTVDSAVLAMKEGAYSYIKKPFDIDQLLSLLAEIAAQVRLKKKAESMAEVDGELSAFPIVFRSQPFQKVIRLVHEVAPSNASVLIFGESGTGKELIAREVHRHSLRRDKAFIAVDANAIPETLLESELFGHIKGSFTGAGKDKVGIIEQADSGTLFLDEIGNLNLAVQSKLLRFLQERKLRRVGDREQRPVDVRLIAATNQDLETMMTEGKFRDDLFYRLSVIYLKIPPLRDRREDIAPLAFHFLRKFNQGFKVEGFRPEVIDLLVDYHWPGNVRQLENAVEHAVILRKAGLIQKRDLPEWLHSDHAETPRDSRSLDLVEKDHILHVLDQCGENKSRAAKILGINRRTLARKLTGYGIQSSDDETD